MPFASPTLFKRGIKSFSSFMYWHLRTKREGWEGVWSQEGYSPYWKTRTIPKDIRDAVDSEWFQPGAALLDIGCGSGEIAAWLAEQGFDVLGVDFAEAAIDLAKSQHPRDPGTLEFKVMDICREAPPGRFNALLDRGCFHHLPKRFLSAYAQNVAACSLPGARFLLLAHTRRTRQVETALTPMFEITRAERTWLVEGAPGVKPYPGMAFYMIRR